jgi:hypothetical protein
MMATLRRSALAMVLAVFWAVGISPVYRQTPCRMNQSTKISRAISTGDGYGASREANRDRETPDSRASDLIGNAGLHESWPQRSSRDVGD